MIAHHQQDFLLLISQPPHTSTYTSSLPVPSLDRQDPTLAPCTLFFFSAFKDFKDAYMLYVCAYILLIIYMEYILYISCVWMVSLYVYLWITYMPRTLCIEMCSFLLYELISLLIGTPRLPAHLVLWMERPLSNTNLSLLSICSIREDCNCLIHSSKEYLAGEERRKKRIRTTLKNFKATINKWGWGWNRVK